MGARLGCPMSKEEVERSRIEASDKLCLKCVGPIECEFHPYALQTVLNLLELAAIQLSLEPRHSEVLELVVNGEPVDPATTLEAAFQLPQATEFRVRGVDRAKALEVNLRVAAMQGDHEMLHLVSQHAPERLDHQNLDGRTALYLVAQQGHERAVRLLLDLGCDPDVPDKDGWTPLAAAAENNHVSMIEILLKAGGDVNHRTTNGCTSLFLVAQHGCHSAVRALLNANANVNQATEDGRTPLFAAARYGHLDVVQVLLQAGADVNLANEDGKLPLAEAKKEGHREVVVVLRDASVVNFGPSPRSPLRGGRARSISADAVQV